MEQHKKLFPMLYQAHHHEYIEDIPFWLDLASKQGSPVLELGCGTGRVLFPLLESGFTCFGVDHDQHMLDVVQDQVTPDITSKLEIIKADFLSLRLGRRFPLIILPCNTYSTLEPGSRYAALNGFFDHLADDGIFAVSIINPDILELVQPSAHSEIETSFSHPLSKNPVQVSSKISQSENSISFQWFYDHLFPDGMVDRLEISTIHYRVSTAQTLAEFKETGYQIEQTFGSFDFSPSTPDSPYLIIIARRI